jgi:hypothetical protein
LTLKAFRDLLFVDDGTTCEEVFGRESKGGGTCAANPTASPFTSGQRSQLHKHSSSNKTNPRHKRKTAQSFFITTTEITLCSGAPPKRHTTHQKSNATKDSQQAIEEANSNA